MNKVIFLSLFAMLTASTIEAQENGIQKIDFMYSANKEILSNIANIKGETRKCPMTDCAYINYSRKRVSMKSKSDNNCFTYYLYEETGRLIDVCSIDLNKDEIAYVSTERVNESSFVLVLESNDGLYFARIKNL